MLRLILNTYLFLLSAHLMGQDPTMGLFLNSDLSYNGYTLMSNNELSYLIDNCGKEINTWTSDYKSGNGIYLLDNGDLLRAGSIPGSFNAGGKSGVFEVFDWDGSLKWQYRIADNSRHAHHDLAILPNGNFLCLVWEKKTLAEALAAGRNNPQELWTESILEIKIEDNNEASIIWKWTAWDHLIQDQDPSLMNYGIVQDHTELLDINYLGAGSTSDSDWLHFNAIAYNKEHDQIALSSRNLSEIYIIDHSTSTLEAASHQGGRYGKGGDFLFRFGNPAAYQRSDLGPRVLQEQHNIEWISDDHYNTPAMSVFNNQYIEGSRSEALVFKNPINADGFYSFDEISGYGDTDILRSYTEVGMFSDILSGVQVLPNKNLLILEGKSGVITEVNEDDEIVWKYIYPINKNGGPGIQGGTVQFNSLFRALRYPEDYSAFSGKDLSPGLPLELSPDDYDCMIYTETVSIEPPLETFPEIIKIYPTLVENLLTIESNSFSGKNLNVYNLQGQIVKSIKPDRNITVLDLSSLMKGVYFLCSNNFRVRFVKI